MTTFEDIKKLDFCPKPVVSFTGSYLEFGRESAKFKYSAEVQFRGGQYTIKENLSKEDAEKEANLFCAALKAKYIDAFNAFNLREAKA